MERDNKVIDLARQTIRTEAEALLTMADRVGDEFREAVEAILASRGKVIMTGVGKSGIVARKIAATLASTGTPSFYLHPAEAFHGDLGMISKEDVVLAMSFSGESDEVLKIIPFIHDNANVLIGMSGSDGSTLAKNSNIHLNVDVEHEACILRLAPTTSTTAQMAMGDALAVALMNEREFTSRDFARLHPGGSLGRRLLMTVENVMRKSELPIVAPDCSAKDMIHSISKGGLGVIVVCREGKIEGIITDGDIRRAMESRESDFFHITAQDIYTRTPKCISPDEKLITAEQMMTQNKVSSLLVSNDKGELKGIIQIYDIKL
ncbi:MAG: KpsF/GutQ family sugar-phosphate isomerase [Rikenellaceae bacterium]